MYKPIEEKKEIIVYKCPMCKEESQYKDSLERHILTEHEYPDFAKKMNFWATNCRFEIKEDAEKMIDLYQKYLAIKYNNYDTRHYVSINWTRPGYYCRREKKEEIGYYESITEHTIVFEWIHE